MPGRDIHGRYWPSVTEILPRFDTNGIPRHVLEYAAARGRGIHRAIHLYELDDLDESSLHPDVRPGLDAYLGFVEATGFETRPEDGEIEVRSNRWGYIGHVDRRGWIGSRRILVDFKRVAVLDRKRVALQLAGYKIAHNEEHPDEPVSEQWALRLMPEGGFRMVRCEHPAAEQAFLACLVLNRWERLIWK